MPDSPPIPAEIWERLLAFIREGKTGQVTLDVHEGRIRSATLQERIRVRSKDG